jgi:DNA-binding NarL/FixJ family response regulator
VKRPRLLLADDHTLVVEGLGRLLESEFELAGVAENGRALVDLAGRLKPDAVLLDISMPQLNGIEAARQIRSQDPSIKLIFVTMHGEASYVTAALEAGASGYILKRSAAAELVNAVREVLRGGTYITKLVDGNSEGALTATPTGRPRKAPGALSARQREVLQLVAEGHSVKEIASILHVSIKTVEFHKAGIVRKLGFHTTAELTRYAIRSGIVQI